MVVHRAIVVPATHSRRTRLAGSGGGWAVVALTDSVCWPAARTPSAGWHSGVVRFREFWQLVDEVLGSAHGRALTRDLVIPGLGNMTPVQALDDGVEPRDVWHALCDELEVPEPQRWGSSRQAPPRRR